MNLIKDIARVLGEHLTTWANTPDTPAMPIAPATPAPIVRVPVDSSMIVSVGHRAADNTLEIEFIGGRVYQYAAVSPDTFLDLIEARSVGQHFNKHIREYYETTEIK